MKKLLLFALLPTFALSVLADEEAPPSFYIASGGNRYVKSIPAPQARGTGNREDGKTQVFCAGPERDTLEYSFDWYSPRLFITWAAGVSIVRLGPWPRGDKASDADLAVSFYRDGKLLKRYSTLDLAGTAENVRKTVSHYDVIKEIVGFVDIFKKTGPDTLTNDPGYGFEITLNDDSHLVFDLATGNRISISDSMFTRRASAR